MCCYHVFTLCTPSADDAHSSHGTEETLCTPSADDALNMCMCLRKTTSCCLCLFVRPERGDARTHWARDRMHACACMYAQSSCYTKIIPAKISGKFPMDMRTPLLKLKIMRACVHARALACPPCTRRARHARARACTLFLQSSEAQRQRGGTPPRLGG